MSDVPVPRRPQALTVNRQYVRTSAGQANVLEVCATGIRWLGEEEKEGEGGKRRGGGEGVGGNPIKEKKLRRVRSRPG